MRRVTEKGSASLLGNPAGKRISIDQLPVYEILLGSFADDFSADGIPVFDYLEHILDLSRE
jgi:hypothetical protein